MGLEIEAEVVLCGDPFTATFLRTEDDVVDLNPEFVFAEPDLGACAFSCGSLK